MFYFSSCCSATCTRSLFAPPPPFFLHFSFLSSSLPHFPSFSKIPEPLHPGFPWSLTPADLKWPRHISAAAVLSVSFSAHFKLWGVGDKKTKLPISALWRSVHLATISGTRQNFSGLPDLLGATNRSGDGCAVADKRLVWDQDGQTVAPKSALRSSFFVTAAEADSVQTVVRSMAGCGERKRKTGLWNEIPHKRRHEGGEADMESERWKKKRTAKGEKMQKGRKWHYCTIKRCDKIE